jgi:quercetin dioxygenase-like cupin family protein
VCFEVPHILYVLALHAGAWSAFSDDARDTQPPMPYSPRPDSEESMSDESHRIVSFESLSFEDRPGRAASFSLCNENYRVRVLSYSTQTEVPEHAHAEGPVFKIVLNGSITYDGSQLLQPGHLASVAGNQRYSASVSPGTVMLLFEPSGSISDSRQGS